LPSNEVPDVELLVELDGLGVEDHPDEELFLTWLRTLIEQLAEDPERDEFARALAAVDEASATERAAAVHGLIEVFKAALHRGSEALAKETEAALGSPWFRIDWLHVTWLTPRRSDMSPLVAGFDDYIDLGEPSNLGPSLIRAIRLDGTLAGFSDLYQRLEQFIEKDLDYREHYKPSFSEGEMSYAELGERYRIRPLFFRDRWLDRDGSAVTLRPAVGESCRDLAARANRLAPSFLARRYWIRIQPPLPDEWRWTGRRASIRLKALGDADESGDFDLDVAATGIATWASYAVSEAMRLAEEERSGAFTDKSPPTPRATVFVLDEPERHLHPLAQDEAASWVADRAREGAHVWLATHATPFLRLPATDVEYLKVVRTEKWQTVVAPITTDVLGAVAECAHELGLPPVAVIQLTRAWLVVEGEHDRLILDALHGQELRQAGIQIIPLRGAARAKASFLNLAALARLDIPFRVLLDNTRADEIKRGLIPVQARTEEERIAEQLIRMRESGVDLDVFGIPYRDIICVLPTATLREVAVRHGGSPDNLQTWDETVAGCDRLRAEWSEPDQKPPDFKSFVLTELGLTDWNADRLVAEALLVNERSQNEPNLLSRVVSEILVSVEERTTA
jgi:hypothetical protein